MVSFILPGNSATGGYEVDNSLRFNSASDDNLSRTPSSASNRKTFTISAWVKKANLGTTQTIIDARIDSNDNCSIFFNDDDNIFIKFKVSPTSQNTSLTTSRKFRDVSAWYHIVLAVDMTQGTDTNRVKFYVNGVQETSFSSATYLAQNTDTTYNNTNEHQLGSRVADTTQDLDGYMAEFVMVDGQALDPTSFGEFDEDSPTIWKPIDVSGLTFGTNGFYLDFENSGSLGADVSGNGNNFTVNNLTSIDQSTDTCTNNFLTWNPLDTTDPGDLTFSEGNLKVVNGTGVCRGTLAASSGKWYWEIKQITAVDASNPIQYGVADTEDSPPTHSSLNNALIAYSDNNTNKAIKKFAAGTESTITSTMGSFNNIAQNDIIQFAFDADTAKLWVGRNGTYLNSGDPANGTGEVASTNSGNFFTPCLEHAGVTYTIESNFGSPPYSISSGNSDANGHGNFEYAVPSGFFAWNTKNLAEFG